VHHAPLHDGLRPDHADRIRQAGQPVAAHEARIGNPAAFEVRQHTEPELGWTKTFTDPRLCAAIVDRLTFAGQIIETGTLSYRLAHARKRRAV
jgi:hypothetical protein